MPSITYTLRFKHCNRTIDEQEHTTAQAAWEAFRQFAEPDSSEIYTAIELVETHWNTRTEYLLAELRFPG